MAIGIIGVLMLLLHTYTTLGATAQFGARVPVARHGAAAPDPLTRHLDMVYVTLHKVKSGAQPGPFGPPSAGATVVTVWLSVTNRNDVQTSINANDFALVTPSGVNIEALPTSPDPALGTTLLDVHGVSVGTVSFETPLGVHHFELRWSPAPDIYGVHWPSADWAIRD